MSYKWNWGIFFQVSPDGTHTYLQLLLFGAGWTIATALLAWAIALSIGAFVGVIRTSPIPWLVRLGNAYVELFRNKTRPVYAKWTEEIGTELVRSVERMVESAK